MEEEGKQTYIMLELLVQFPLSYRFELQNKTQPK